jgi:hypothetical protein
MSGGVLRTQQSCRTPVGPKKNSRGGTQEELPAKTMAKESSLFFLAKLAFERVFGARTGFGEIAVRAFDQRMFVAVGKLARHRIVPSLFAFVGFERALVTVCIILKMITSAIRHEKPLSRFRGKDEYFTILMMSLHATLAVGKTSIDDALAGGNDPQVVVIHTIAKFYGRLTYV